MKYAVFMSLWPRTIKILISNWPWTRKFSQLFRNTVGKNLFLPRSRVGHALRQIFMLWGPFLESPGNFTGKKSNIQIEI